MVRNKRPEIFVRRQTVCGIEYGPIMLLTSKTPAVAVCTNLKVTVTMLPKSFKILKGIALPISVSCMDRIISGKQTKVIHTVDHNYNERLLDEKCVYVKLYDCNGRKRFYILDFAYKDKNLGQMYMYLTLGGLFYEKNT